jgi:hypothetical protein
MKEFLQAFGGLIGVVVICALAVAGMVAADWLLARFLRKAKDEHGERTLK